MNRLQTNKYVTCDIWCNRFLFLFGIFFRLVKSCDRAPNAVEVNSLQRYFIIRWNHWKQNAIGIALHGCVRHRSCCEMAGWLLFVNAIDRFNTVVDFGHIDGIWHGMAAFNYAPWTFHWMELATEQHELQQYNGWVTLELSFIMNSISSQKMISLTLFALRASIA